MDYIKWTQRLIDQIRKLIDKGLTRKQVSRELGIPYTKVCSACRRFDIKKFSPEEKHKRMEVLTSAASHEEASRELGISTGTVRSLRSRMRSNGIHVAYSKILERCRDERSSGS